MSTRNANGEYPVVGSTREHSVAVGVSMPLVMFRPRPHVPARARPTIHNYNNNECKILIHRRPKIEESVLVNVENIPTLKSSRLNNARNEASNIRQL